MLKLEGYSAGRFFISCLVAVLILTAGLPSFAIEATINLASAENSVQLARSSDQMLIVNYRFSEISSFDVQTVQGDFSHIGIDGLSYTTRLGEPKLPVCRKIIAVPLQATVSTQVLNYTLEEYELSEYGITHPIIPAQPSLSKSQSPEEVAFVYDAAAYSTAGFGSQTLVSAEELGILRGMRLFLLTVEPVKYDPVRHALAVYNDLEVEVVFSGGSMEATRDLHRRTYSPYFESIYQQFVLNYERVGGLDDDLTSYPVKYIIISDRMFEAQLAPFIEWKTQQGFEMILGYTDQIEVGATTTSIHNYIQNLYDAGTPEDPAPSFVLFVGDEDQVPAYSGNTGSHITDLHYVRLDGLSNYLPEMYYGRFSAQTTADLQPQIDKTLEYERFEMPDPSYLSEVVMIAGVDASHAPTWGNGQIYYGTNYYFNAAHGITSHTYFYPESGSSETQIINNVSNGVGYANYTAHGGSTSWSDPSFTISDIDGLNNVHKYPTVVGNCCLTNKFDVSECFGEAWLRAENKGSVGYIGGTNSTYWDEDYWWGVGAGSVSATPTYEGTGPGAYDGMFHDHGESFPEWYTVQYAFIMAGNLAVVEGGGSTDYCCEIYALMGDPSLCTYFGVPSANTVSYTDPILLGTNTITVSADSWSYVGLSSGGELKAAGLIDATGEITLEFDPFAAPGTADLVITRQNREPVITQIDVIANEGPYLVMEDVAVSDAAGGNGNGEPEFGETLAVSITEENVGIEDADEVTVQISSDDPYLTVSDGSEYYGTVPAGQQVVVTDGFQVVVDPDVPDGREINVSVSAADNAEHDWNDVFIITAHAPDLAVEDAEVDDSGGNGNGLMDAGETVLVNVTLYNDGSCTANSIEAVLSTDYDYATVTQSDADLSVLNPAQSDDLTSFTVEVLPGAPAMDNACFYITLTMTGGRTTQLLLELPIGGFLETVENGAGNWSHEAAQTGWEDQWHISTESAHSPTRAWKCGDSGTGSYANHMDAVLVTPAITLTGPSELHFTHRIDAEISSYYPDSAYDGGIVEISEGGGPWEQLMPVVGGYNKWIRCTAGGSNPYTGPFSCGIPCFSGSIDWTEVVCDLSPYTGSVQIRFHFGSDDGGADEGWYVDDIQVKFIAGINPPRNLQAELTGSDAHLSWNSPESGATLSVLEGYHVYREGVKIDSFIQTLEYNDDLTEMPWDTYDYTVTAQFSDGESSHSNSVAVVWSDAPDAVTDLTISISGSDVTLRWTPVADADEYYVYSSEDGEEFTEPPAIVTAPPYQFTVDMETYTMRFYMIRAVRN